MWCFMRVYSHTQTAVHIHTWRITVTLIMGKTLNIPNWSLCWDKGGADSGISGLYLWSKYKYVDDNQKTSNSCNVHSYFIWHPKSSIVATDLDGRYQTSTPCYQHGGSNWGIQVFPMIKIRFVRCVCHPHQLRLDCEDKCVWKATWRARLAHAYACKRSLGNILFMFVSVWVVGKDPNTPNWSSMADDAITWVDMRDPGSPLYICSCCWDFDVI